MMLMEDFEEWAERYRDLHPECKMKENLLFEIFYQQHSVGKSFMELLAESAFELYQAQVCIEGLLEDIEEIE